MHLHLSTKLGDTIFTVHLLGHKMYRKLLLPTKANLLKRFHIYISIILKIEFILTSRFSELYDATVSIIFTVIFNL